MIPVGFVRLLMVATLALGASSAAHAQLGVTCKDPWINQAFTDLYARTPVVANPHVVSSDGECNPALYGGGHWSSYMDLENKIIAVKGPRKGVITAAPPSSASSAGAFSGVTLDVAKGVLIDHGTSTPLAQVDFVGQNGSALSVSQAAAIVAQGGGNIVAQGGGNLTGGPNNYRVGGAAAPPRKKYMVIKK